jgi:hypothetical protein
MEVGSSNARSENVVLVIASPDIYGREGWRIKRRPWTHWLDRPWPPKRDKMHKQ